MGPCGVLLGVLSLAEAIRTLRSSGPAEPGAYGEQEAVSCGIDAGMSGLALSCAPEMFGERINDSKGVLENELLEYSSGRSAGG